MIKAAFFDIDGTLVSLKTKVYPPNLPPVLRKLRENGVLLFVATGRSKFEIATEHLLDGLEFDGLLTNNGQDAYDTQGNLLYSKPLNPVEVERVLDYVEATNSPCWMVGGEKSCLNFCNEAVQIAMDAIHTAPPEVGDLREMAKKPVYKIVLFCTKEEMATPMALAPTSRTTQWFDLGHDIISKDGGKKNAMLEIMERYGIAPEECMAFGDSENDIEMLQAAGIGVSMGNGTKEAKAAANYVTTDCDEDGIINALKHFELL